MCLGLAFLLAAVSACSGRKDSSSSEWSIVSDNSNESDLTTAFGEIMQEAFRAREDEENRIELHFLKYGHLPNEALVDDLHNTKLFADLHLELERLIVRYFDSKVDRTVAQEEGEVKIDEEVVRFCYENPCYYIIVIDAGSTGSRCNLFVFKKKLETERFAVIKNYYTELKGFTMTTLKNDYDKLKKGFIQMLSYARKIIPESKLESTQILLKGTGGMRILKANDPQGCERLIQNIKQIFKDSFPTRLDKLPNSRMLEKHNVDPAKLDTVSVLESIFEGLFAWFALNHLRGTLIPGIPLEVQITRYKSHPSFVLELGGASFQLTGLTTTDRTRTEQKNYLHMGSIFGSDNKYPLYTRSYLDYGGSAAFKGVMLLDNSIQFPHLNADMKAGQFQKYMGATFNTSCLPSMYEDLTDIYGQPFSFRGIYRERRGDTFYACLNQIEKFIEDRDDYLDVKLEELKQQPIIVCGLFYHCANRLNLLPVNSQDGNNMLTIWKYKEYAKVECESPTPIYPKSCSDLTFVYSTLKKLGLSDNDQVNVLNEVHKFNAGWPLGAAIHYLHGIREF